MLGQDQPPRWPDAGKVLGLAHADAPEGGQGKPCGKSHISKRFKCSAKDASVTTGNQVNLKKWAAVGISAAAVGGIAAVLYHRKQSREAILAQLRAQQQSNRDKKVDEHTAIYNYVAGSMGLNRALRNGTELTDHYQLMQTGLDSWLSDAPKQQGVFFRGIPMRANSEWNTVAAGQVITDKGYTSFSKSREVAKGYGTNGIADDSVVVVARGKLPELPMHISNKYGRKLPEAYREASEHLAPRNTRYKVTKVRDIKERYAVSTATGIAQRSSKGTHIRNIRVVYVEF